MKISRDEVVRFRQTLAGQSYRPMPWREDHSPYRVLVSEIMLQQTQVIRVIPKFEVFLHRFPDIQVLATAPLADVLRLWSGLGYNRRAKFLHETAKKIVAVHDGAVPDSLAALVSLPGVGSNTAGAILAYAFNQPAIFIETNIRTTLLHYFFKDRVQVSEAELKEALAQLIDRQNPRAFYWAVMDYGAHLKAQVFGGLTRSQSYKKQSPLRGSLREMRGMILKELSANGLVDAEVLNARLGSDSRFEPAIAALIQEGLITEASSHFRLTGDGN